MSAEPRFARPTPKVKALPTVEDQPWSLLSELQHAGPAGTQAATEQASSSLRPADTDAPSEPKHVFPPLPPALPSLSDKGGSLSDQPQHAERPLNPTNSPNQLEEPKTPQKPIEAPTHEEQGLSGLEPPSFDLDLEADVESALEDYEPSQTAEELEYYNSVSDGSSWEVLGGSPPMQMGALLGGQHSSSSLLPQSMSTSVVPALVSSELISNVSFGNLKFPWEKGPLRSVFAERPVAILPSIPQGFKMLAVGSKISDTTKPALPTKTSNVRGVQGVIFVSVIKASKDVAFLERRAELMKACIVRLRATIMMLDPGSVPINLKTNGQVDEESLAASIGVRSPLTVSKRVSSFNHLVTWFLDSNSKTSTSILSEQSVWEYLLHLKRSGAAASKGAGAVSAVRFFHHVLGFDFTRALGSRRIAGVAEQMLAGSRWVRQAAELTVLEVRGLHQLSDSQEAHVWDKAIASYTLVALYGRCRHSDLSDVHSIKLEVGPTGEGFLILFLGQHKTSRLQARSRRLLPVLVPTIGITGTEWVSSALANLKAVGLQTEGDINGPLLRPLTSAEATQLCNREIRSQEVTAFLRKAISSLVSESRALQISSHSLKRTALSWGSKYGLTQDEKSVLGRHASATLGSQAIYSVDLASAPARALQKVIVDIASGSFRPDNPIAQYFRPQPTPVPGPRNLEPAWWHHFS